jgi:aryl carrier-like protein
VDSIPASTNLYHLGLDSISAIKVSTLLRKRSIHLKPRDLLNATNIQQMARLVKQPADVPNPTRQLQWSPPAEIDVDKLLVNNQISRSEIASVLPALPMQVYMMSAWQNSNGAVFFPEFCYRIDGKVDVRSIQEAWDWVVAQSPILRSAVIGTGFAEVPMLQVILKPGKQSPLVQFQVTGDRHTDLHAVHIRLHHALYDGVSLPGILQKFASRLNGSSEGGRPEDDLQSWGTFVVEPTLQSATNLRRQFWTDYLHGCKPSSTLEDRSGEGLGTPRVSYLRKSALPTTSQLRKASTRNGISIQSLFIAAYGKVLAGSHSAAGQDGSVVFGVYLANRHDTALADTYPTLNLVPLRVRSAGARSLCESAAAVQDDLDRIGSRGRADVGLWEVAAWTGVKVASFVNFLTLPDAGSEATADLDVKLVPAHSTAGPVDTSLVQQWTQQNDNVVQDAFPVSSPSPSSYYVVHQPLKEAHTNISA